MQFILAIMALAAIALFWGAWHLWRVRGLTTQPALMAALGLILLANVAIWAIPNDQGVTLLDGNLQAE